MDKLSLLKALVGKGCELVVSVPAVGGARCVVATPEQALRLLEDEYTVYGELVGLSRSEYIDWASSQGTVYCLAKTRKGLRCRHAVVGATLLEPDAWKTMCDTGGYCGTHGG